MDKACCAGNPGAGQVEVWFRLTLTHAYEAYRIFFRLDLVAFHNMDDYFLQQQLKPGSGY